MEGTTDRAIELVIQTSLRHAKETNDRRNDQDQWDKEDSSIKFQFHYAAFLDCQFPLFYPTSLSTSPEIVSWWRNWNVFSIVVFVNKTILNQIIPKFILFRLKLYEPIFWPFFWRLIASYFFNPRTVLGSLGDGQKDPFWMIFWFCTDRPWISRVWVGMSLGRPGADLCY